MKWMCLTPWTTLLLHVYIQCIYICIYMYMYNVHVHIHVFNEMYMYTVHVLPYSYCLFAQVFFDTCSIVYTLPFPNHRTHSHTNRTHTVRH